jgi:hypothetical protein
VEVFLTELPEDPWRIVFEFEVILCAWGELVTNDVEIILVPRGIVLICDRALEFGLTPGDLGKRPFEW